MLVQESRNIFITFLLSTLLLGREDFALGHIHQKNGVPHLSLGKNEKASFSGKVMTSRGGRPYKAFIGIPYATIPERFAEAQLITEYADGVKPADKEGPLCTQSGWMADNSVNAKLVGEENCLNLNVYVPMNSTGKGHPVMVFIHGGGFVSGGGYLYGANFFLDEDVILVTINYRLGVFGFLSTGDSVIPGNNGLKDVVLALRWVQENARKFEGDPGTVTIFGESAGGATVNHLLLSPTTKGLFHRAISQSGSALEAWAYFPNPKADAVKLATHMKCPTTAKDPSGISSEEILACLRKPSTDELNKAQFAFKTSFPSNFYAFYFGPTKEPSGGTPFQTESPYSILTNRKHALAEIPWMVGVNEDEGTCMFAGTVLKSKELLTQLDTKWNQVAPEAFELAKLAPKDELVAVAEKLRKFYFGSRAVSAETADKLTHIYSDQLVDYGVYKAALETATRGEKNPVYLYQYAHHGYLSCMGLSLDCAKDQKKKVGHGDEILYQFEYGKIPPPLKKEDAEFSKHLVKLWVSFATHGKPTYSWGNSPGKTWSPISKEEADGKRPLTFYRIDTSSTGPIENPYKERMDFWDKLCKDHFEKMIK